MMSLLKQDNEICMYIISELNYKHREMLHKISHIEKFVNENHETYVKQVYNTWLDKVCSTNEYNYDNKITWSKFYLPTVDYEMCVNVMKLSPEFAFKYFNEIATTGTGMSPQYGDSFHDHITNKLFYSEESFLRYKRDKDKMIFNLQNPKVFELHEDVLLIFEKLKETHRNEMFSRIVTFNNLRPQKTYMFIPHNSDLSVLKKLGENFSMVLWMRNSVYFPKVPFYTFSIIHGCFFLLSMLF